MLLTWYWNSSANKANSFQTSMPPLEIIHIPPHSTLRRKSQAGTILNYNNWKSLPLWALWIRIWWEAIYKHTQFSASLMRIETMLSTVPINLTSQESGFETSNSRSYFVCFLFRKKRRRIFLGIVILSDHKSLERPIMLNGLL